jgi:hypothetical protein
MITREITDPTKLPGELLSLAKSHCRILFDDDDAYLTSLIGSMIDLFERLTQFWVFGSTVEWVPGPSDVPRDIPGACYGVATASTWQLPCGPASTSFTATDADAGDCSTRFAILGDAGTGAYAAAVLQLLPGEVLPTALPVTVSLTVGFEAAADLPPALTDIILRMVAWRYEQREMGLMPGVDVTPYANSLITSFWVPRC